MKSTYLWLSSILIIGNWGYGKQEIVLAKLSPSILRNELEDFPFEVSKGGLNLPMPSSGSGSPNSTIGAGTRLYLPPVQQERPSSTAGGGKRGCISQNKIQVLLPRGAYAAIAKSPEIQSRLWIYIPDDKAIMNVKMAEFTIFEMDNNADEPIFKKTITDIDNRKGFFTVSIPEDLLVAEKGYWWDMTFRCDLEDRSDDSHSFGELQLQEINDLKLSRDPDIIKSLETALLAPDSVLTLPNRKDLGARLATDSDTSQIQEIENELRSHYQELLYQYALTPDPNIALELAQISAFFGLWGDTVDFLATHREDYPEAWEMIMETFLYNFKM